MHPLVTLEGQDMLLTAHRAEASALNPLASAQNSMIFQDKAVSPGYEACWQLEAPIIKQGRISYLL